jgi:hypothetical protein
VSETTGSDSMKIGIQKTGLECFGTIFIDRSPVTRGKYDITRNRLPDGSVRARTLVA